jgi:hypothetical protein
MDHVLGHSSLKNQHGGPIEYPKYLKLNVNLERMVMIVTKYLLREFMDVFAWNYKELRGSHLTLENKKLN